MLYDSGKVVICDQCGDRFGIVFNKVDYQAWKGGALIQNAMPYLSADDRELLISKLCPGCFGWLFKEEGSDGS